MSTFRAHPAAEVFPMMSDSEIAKLAEDIKRNGQSLPIITMVEDNQTLILDGRNRARACELAGVAVLSQPYGGEDPFSFVVSANLRRRHLSVNERAMLSAQVDRLRHGSNQFCKKEDGARAPSSPTRVETAGLFDISVESVKRARKIADAGCPELVAAVRASEVSLKAGAKLARMPKEEQRSRLEAGDIPKDKPSQPPASQPSRVADVKSDTARGSTATIKKIRDLTEEGLSAQEIVSNTGLSKSVVYAARRQRKNPLAGAVLDAQSFADAWNARARGEEMNWMLAANSAERDELAEALAECARAARKMINRLKKEAEKDRATS